MKQAVKNIDGNNGNIAANVIKDENCMLIETLTDLEKLSVRKGELTSLPTQSFSSEACNDCCCDVGCETYI